MTTDRPTCCGTVAWDPAARGRTCGGLDVRGAYVCGACGAIYIGEDSRPDEGPWRLAASGRSVEVGRARIRVDGDDGPALCARIVRLPDLEQLVDLVRALRITDALALANALAAEATTPVDTAPAEPTIERPGRTRRKGRTE